MTNKEIYIPKIIDNRERIGEPTIIKVIDFYLEEELRKATIKLNEWKDKYLDDIGDMR